MDAIDRLTIRQRACLRLVACGYTSKEIGRELGISPATVDNHIRASLEVLQVGGRAEAARLLRGREVTSQPLTSQPRAIAAGPADAPNPGAADRPGHQRFRLIPPLGGQRNDLRWYDKITAIMVVALVSAITLAVLTLGATVVLWWSR